MYAKLFLGRLQDERPSRDLFLSLDQIVLAA